MPPSQQPDLGTPSACIALADIAARETCLAAVTPAGMEHDAKEEEPFGYVCVLFGMGRAQCTHGSVRAVKRWVDTARPKCPLHLAVYHAPMQNPRGAAADLANGSPEQKLTPLIWPSDGSVFGYVRVDDYVLEAQTCDERGAEVETKLVDWATEFQPLLFPSSPGS